MQSKLPFILLAVAFLVVTVGSTLVTVSSLSRLQKVQVHKIEVEVPTFSPLGGISTFGVSDLTNASTTISADATTSILAVNTGRQYARITNTSTTGVARLELGSSLLVGDAGIIVLDSLDFYEIDADNPYVGVISAWTGGGTSTISTIEH